MYSEFLSVWLSVGMVEEFIRWRMWTGGYVINGLVHMKEAAQEAR